MAKTQFLNMVVSIYKGDDGAVHIRLDSGRPWISFYVYKFGSDPGIGAYLHLSFLGLASLEGLCKIQQNIIKWIKCDLK